MLYNFMFSLLPYFWWYKHNNNKKPNHS